MDGAVVRRVIPSDNSCLFNAVGYVMEHDKHKASELRQLEQYKISHDYRETNRIADKLESLLPNSEFIEIIPSSFAEDLKDIVQEDRIGKTS